MLKFLTIILALFSSTTKRHT